jgi:hypothetical protein
MTLQTWPYDPILRPVSCVIPYYIIIIIIIIIIIVVVISRNCFR